MKINNGFHVVGRFSIQNRLPKPPIFSNRAAPSTSPRSAPLAPSPRSAPLAPSPRSAPLAPSLRSAPLAPSPRSAPLAPSLRSALASVYSIKHIIHAPRQSCSCGH